MKTTIRKNKRHIIKDIARQRIEILLDQAYKNILDNPRLSRRYVYLALQIAKKTRVRLPKKHRIYICRKCYTYLVSGITATIRLRQRRSPHLVLKCNNCKNIKRIPYKL